MRFTSFTGPRNPIKQGKNAKVAKSTRVCPPIQGPVPAFVKSVSFLRSIRDPKSPEGPKIEKIQDFAPGLKLSSDQSQIEAFNRD